MLILTDTCHGRVYNSGENLHKLVSDVGEDLVCTDINSHGCYNGIATIIITITKMCTFALTALAMTIMMRSLLSV
jgi:hypothetical protein